MNTLISTPLCNLRIAKFPSTSCSIPHSVSLHSQFLYKPFQCRANPSDLIDSKTAQEPEQELSNPATEIDEETDTAREVSATKASSGPKIDQDLKKVRLLLVHIWFRKYWVSLVWGFFSNEVVLFWYSSACFICCLVDGKKKVSKWDKMKKFLYTIACCAEPK